MTKAEIKAAAKEIAFDDTTREARVHAIIALCDRVREGVREGDARTCDYYSEERGDIASQAAAAIRSQGGQ